ncbi:hypothetical protein CMK20_18970 [Candidatus Poribacteria bacterium]|nr:hypothetical protein [Candidatus Poribacteria bacterium]
MDILRNTMEIYDIIHGNILLCPIAKKIIDTIEFQRLRNIKQLGCCYLVFPSAVHTRFEHSIGVYHLANKYIQKLNKDKKFFTEREIECITIAGLIHDIGHGPYSHLFDETVDQDKNHEYRSGKLLELMNQKYNLGFTEKDINFILKIIYPKKYTIDPLEKYKYQIISNKTGIDVDRFDYITRDIHMTGLNYGIEYERIMNNSKIIDGSIQYSDKVQTNIEEFFRIRFIMYKEVYNHRTVRCLEYMMKEFMNEIDSVINIKRIINEDQWDEFIKINDNIIDIINFISNNDKLSKLKEIIHNINTRNIYKSIGEIEVSISNGDKEHFKNIKESKLESLIIIDKIEINYYGEEECQYYSNNKYHKVKTEYPDNKDIYIISIYYKNSESKEFAKLFFQQILP